MTAVREPVEREDLPELAALPAATLPQIPASGRLWARAMVLVSVAVGLYLLDRLALLLMDFWLLQSLGLDDVFWTNFWTGAAVFAVSFVGTTAAVALPAFLHPLPREVRRRALQLGILAGVLDDVLVGALFAGRFRDYLLFANAVPFGEVDPVFGLDLGFYVFRLPAIWTTWAGITWVVVLALTSSVICALLAARARPAPAGLGAVHRGLAAVATAPTRLFVGLLGVVLASGVWLTRYDLLLRDNAASSIPAGAEHLDVAGVLSTLNGITLAAVGVLGLAAAAVWKLGAYRRLADAAEDARAPLRRQVGARALALAFAPLLVANLVFASLVALRDELAVTPNEPVVQFPYIQRHVEATARAFGLEDLEQVRFVPNGPQEPVPDAETLLASPTLRNAPLWPGFVSRLERLLDPQHADRVFLTDGDATVYGPTLEVFFQQEKLRPYYGFLDVDTVRYDLDGEVRVLASAVRELPLNEPQPWLAWWGQRFVLFTHGHGLVMSPVGAVDGAGGPIYVSRGLPSRVVDDDLAAREQGIYYGEGSGSMAYSNVAQLDEFDFPTEEGRAEVRYADDIVAGVRVDSWLKRLVFGYKSRQLLDILFSGLITEETRVHYFRTPLERLEHVAPFLYFDTDPYAVTGRGSISWLINGITTSDRYPYSQRIDLGDKSVSRTPTPRPHRWVNYAADSVKATIDAHTGQVALYQISDEPVVATWARIYPDLFTPAEEMHPSIRSQLQYPTQLFHTQFDDLYVYYHLQDALEFFNLEDLWDDGDEVLGPILDTGDAITFSIEPYQWLAETGEALPAGEEDATQFALSMAFTPENALNLRAIASAYQDGPDYGRLVVLRVPKAEFVPGPEQADAAIDQDPDISAQISLWNRQGNDVIRGHTTPLVIGNELLYVEPIFLRSEQNPTPQLARAAVVLRGVVAWAPTLEEAVRSVVDRLEQGPAAGDAQPELSPASELAEDAEAGGPPPHAGGDDDEGSR